jgi:hypothetical protein
MNAANKMRVTHAANYPFRLRDPVSGRWVRARFIAKLKDIAGCCAAWEIVPSAPSEPDAR